MTKEDTRWWAVLSCGRDEADVLDMLADRVFATGGETAYLSGPLFVIEYNDDAYIAVNEGYLNDQ